MNGLRSTAEAKAAPASFLRLARISDLAQLTKPNIVSMCLLTTIAGMALAPGDLPLARALAALFGTCLVVASANALNMLLERDVDRLMHRTRHRPLPDGRMTPAVALAFGLTTGVAGLIILALKVNPLTALLAALAIDTYVLLYTPLKRISHHALLVGTIPGAMPALIGWTAVTGVIDPPGVALFVMLALWQLPHFIAISLYQAADYARAGIRVLPSVVGEAAARRRALVATLLLVPAGLALVPLGVAGWAYALVVGAGSLYFVASACLHLRQRAGLRGARRFFFASLFYPPVLGLAILLNALILTKGVP